LDLRTAQLGLVLLGPGLPVSRRLALLVRRVGPGFAC